MFPNNYMLTLDSIRHCKNERKKKKMKVQFGIIPDTFVIFHIFAVNNNAAYIFKERRRYEEK